MPLIEITARPGFIQDRDDLCRLLRSVVAEATFTTDNKISVAIFEPIYTDNMLPLNIRVSYGIGFGEGHIPIWDGLFTIPNTVRVAIKSMLKHSSEKTFLKKGTKIGIFVNPVLFGLFDTEVFS